MSKEREIAEAIFKDYSGRRGFGLECLKYDDPDIYKELLDQQEKLIRERLATSTAPQSELEAVGLLRNTIEFLRVEAATLERLSLDGYYDQGTWMRMAGTFAKDIRGHIAQIETFLSRPPGPDWRTLAVDAFTSWQSNALSSSTVHYMHELHDAALAAEKRGA